MSGDNDNELAGELVELTEALIEGSISPEGHSRLEVLLRADKTARSYFLDCMQMHGALQWDIMALLGPDADRHEGDGATAGKPRSGLPLRLLSWRFGFAVSLLSAAAVLAILVLPWSMRSHQGGQRTPGGQSASPSAARHSLSAPVGAIRRLDNARWQNPAFSPSVGDFVHCGPLRLASGTAQIELFSGASIVLAGPCSLDLESASTGSLHQGALLVSILQPDAQFSVQTPVGELLHYGTEYGVSVGPTGTTEMYVYEGTVEVQPLAIDLVPQSSRLVRQGGIVEIQPSGQVNGSLATQAPAPFEVFHKSVGPSSKPASYAPRLPFVSAEGFTVRFVKSASTPINSIGKADDLLAGRIPSSKQVAAEKMSQINLQGGPWDPVYIDLFPHNLPFPGHSPDREENDFVVRVTGTLIVPDSWQYSFAMNVDDGGRLRIDGQDVLLDNGIHPPQVSLGAATLARGSHALELIYYNQGGCAQLELGIAVGGTKRLQDFSPLSVRAE